MLVAMSQRSRRFVGRLDRGQELVGAIRALCKERDVRSGEIRASGLLTAVEIAPYDRESRGYAAPRRLRAFFELLHLHGTIALRDGEITVQLHATLTRDNQDRGGGIDILGGTLLQAEVLTCEFVLEAFDDVSLVREFDPTLGVYALARAEPRTFVREEIAARPGTGPSLAAQAPPPAPASDRIEPPRLRPSVPAPRPIPAREPEVVRARPQKPLPKIPEGRPIPSRNPPAEERPRNRPEVAIPDSDDADEPSWEDAVRRSIQLADDADSTLHLGDILEHPRFGRCEVQRIDRDEERIAVRLENGRIVELGLEVLSLERLRTEGDRQHFRVHLAKRGA
jgi:hypothetical protein